MYRIRARSGLPRRRADAGRDRSVPPSPRGLRRMRNRLGYATLGIANGWGAVAAVGARIAPLSRAFGSLLQHPPVEAALWAAAVICVALLGLLHRGERPSSRGVDPLGIVGV